MLRGAALLALAWADPAGAVAGTLTGAAPGDFALRGGQVWSSGRPTGELILRSGGPNEVNTAVFPTQFELAVGAVIERVSFTYSYDTGYGPDGVGTNFTVRVAGQPVYASPELVDYRYSENRSNYSAPVGVDVSGLSITVPHAPGAASAANRIEIEFQNNARNVQLLLPLDVDVTCAGDQPCVIPAPPPPGAPVEVYHVGDKDEHSTSYGCFRIPALVRTSNNTLLAFAEGRVDGCKPDVNINRPIVVRSSYDEGATWSLIRVAVPGNTRCGLNYPAPVVVGDQILLHYHGCGGVNATVSSDDGLTWTELGRAGFQGGGCGVGGAAKLSETKLVMACADHAEISDDGGKTWRWSKGNVSKGENVSGLGESLMAADGRPGSVAMFIRSGSNDALANHAVALSNDGGETWTDARLLPDVMGTTCQGSIGHDPKGPPGELLLSAPSWPDGGLGGRKNMSVWTLDDTSPTSRAVSQGTVWGGAAGYSVFETGGERPLLLYEAGDHIYNYGIKLSKVDIYRTLVV